MGVGIGLPWTWYLVMPGIVWIAALMTADRIRQGRRRALPGDPLVRGCESSLAEVEHQIWLLRNVHWWYLLPLAVPMLAFFAHVFWRLSRGNVGRQPSPRPSQFVIVVLPLLDLSIDQKAVRSTLEPRHQDSRRCSGAFGRAARPLKFHTVSRPRISTGGRSVRTPR